MEKKIETEMEDRPAELSEWGYLGVASMILRVQVQEFHFPNILRVT